MSPQNKASQIQLVTAAETRIVSLPAQFFLGWGE